MRALWAGIDGGQSSTVAAIGNERGEVLGCGRAGPADEVGATARSTRLRDALEGAVQAALRNAGLARSARFEAIVAGISGFEGAPVGRTPRLRAAVVRLLHDAPIAHAGAFALEPGVVVIAGTGSVVYSGTPDAGTTAGGWGYLFGDEGSGFGLVRDALAAVMRAQDAGGGFERERDALLDFFGYPTLRALAAAHYRGALSRDRLAAYAGAVLEAPGFAEVVARGAAQLAAVAAAQVRRSGCTEVALGGGLAADVRYRDAIATEVMAGAPHARVVPARFDPARGALLLAYRASRRDVRELYG